MNLPQRRLQILAVLIAVLVAAAIGAVFAMLVSWHGSDRDHAVVQTGKRAAQVVTGVANRIDGIVRSIDFALLEIRREYGADDARFRAIVDSMARLLPAGLALQLSVAGPDGTIAYSTLGPVTGVSIRDRDHFRVHLGGEDRLFVSKPVVGRVSKVASIQFSRPILRSGRVAGVAVVSVSPQALAGVLGSFRIDEKDSVALIDDEGTALARYPALPGTSGRNVPSSRPFLGADAPARGVFRGVSSLDGARRTFAWERIAGTRLVAVVGLDEVTVFAPLDRQYRQYELAALIVSGALAVLGILVLVLLARATRHQREALASENRFRQLTMMSTDWYWEQDAQHRFTFLSSWLDARGLQTPTSALGHTRWELGALNLSEADWAAHRALLERHEPFRDFVIQREYVDGSRRWLSVRGEPVYDDQGRFTGYRGTGHDITEKRQADEALAEAREFLQQIVDTSPSMIFVVDAEGRTVFVNRFAADYYRTTPQALIGRTVQGLHPEPQEAEGFASDDREVIRHGRVVVKEERNTAPDGRVHWFHTIKVPLVRKDGRVELLGIATDITERKRAEEATDRSSARLAALVDAALDGIIIADAEGRIVRFNPAAERLFGYSEHEVLGQPATIVLPGGVDHAAPPVPGVAHAGPGRLVENLAGRHRDGREIPLEATFSRVEAAGQRLETVILRDISERLKAQDALRELMRTLESRVAERTAELEASLRELESFSYSVSHDLQAPLRGISGHANLLRDELGPGAGAEAGRHLDLIDRSATQMGALIDGLLQIARTSRAPILRSPVDMTAMVREVVDELRPGPWGRARVEVGDLPPAFCDPTLIRQVWRNLLGNALKFSSRVEWPRVEVGAGRDRGAVFYFVRDNGAGFDARFAAKLFGVFQRLHSPQEFEGTGVGLATVHRIVERHGGRLWAEGAPGAGATFRFTLGPPA